MFGTYILRQFPVHHFGVWSYVHAVDGFHCSLVFTIILCKQTGRHMDSFVLIKRDQIKKLQLKQSRHLYVFYIDHLDEGCTLGIETDIFKHKDCLYYSESEEEGIVDEGKQRLAIRK